MKKLVLITFSLAGFLTEITAQTQDFQMDTVSIESSRLGLTSNQMGRFVTIIDQEQLAALPARSIDEILRFLPGLEVQARGAFGTQADFTMRGGTFNQVLVLMDGMRINDPLTGHFQAYLPVVASEIDRIEIIRGPASAQYGPDAVGGVINIVTRTFSDQSKSPDKQLSVNARAGQNALLGAEMGYVGSGANIRGGIGGRYLRSDGHPLPSGKRADFDMATAGASLGIRMNDWDLAFRSGWDQRTFQAQYFYTTSTFDESREQTGRWWNQARISHQGTNSRTSLDVSFLSSRDSFLFNPAFAANIHQTGFLNANLHHQQAINSQLSWAGGAQFSQRSITSSDRGDHQDAHAAVYGMLYAQPHHNIHLNISLRLDQDANYGTELSPQINVSVVEGNTTLRAGMGRAIRAADYTERFISTEIPGPLSGGRNLGNPDLQAETSWNYEIGADLQFSPALSASSTLFYRRGTNLIDYILTPATLISNNGNLSDSASYLWASNLSSLNTAGAEFMIRYQKRMRQGSRFSGDIGYTLLNIQSPDGLASKYLANVARQQISIRGMLESRYLFAGVQGLWRQRDAENAAAIGAELSPTFAVWHLQGGTRLMNGKARLGVQVYNVFNTEYADLLGARMPGRWWVLNASFNL